VIERAFWNEAGEAGLLGVSIPTEFGGAGGDFRHDVVLIDMVARMDISGFAVQLHNVIVSPYVLLHGTDEQRRRWLPRLCSGELIAAVAMTEPGAGSDLQGIRTTARRDGDGYRINGQKTFISSGQIANFIIVAAKTGDEDASGISLFIVETDEAEGFRRGRKLDKVGLDAQDTSELYFDDVWVPAENLLGGREGCGFKQLMAELPRERLVIAIIAMAMIERALATTIEHVTGRRLFGQRLLDFQNTQFKLAECKTEATIAKVFLNHCLQAALDRTLDTVTASMAKYWITDLQNKIVDECLQLHGGYGYINEYPIARMYRDARISRIYGGANEIMKMVIARSFTPKQKKS
jgi:alkylation response protein AidB-like acyl-CoA dehydrogenase